jgi:hypothetical protein
MRRAASAASARLTPAGRYDQLALRRFGRVLGGALIATPISWPRLGYEQYPNLSLKTAGWQTALSATRKRLSARRGISR